MSQSRSIIYSLPIKKLDALLDRLGLERTWYSILATHLNALNRRDLHYILKSPEFRNALVQDFDLLDNLTVGEISAVYEYSLAYLNRDSRKKEGQFFTPDDVAQFMAKKSSLFSKNKVWVDPCSGVGNLTFWLIKFQKNPETFLKTNVYLVDRDPLALFIARFVLATHFQNEDARLFESIKKRFIVADFLSADSLPNYDYAILNPPYVVVGADPRFETSKAGDLYAYFLEKIIKTSDGFISITPQTFTNGQKFSTLRRLLLGSFSALDIFCFDNVPDNIFRGIKFGTKNSNTANSTRAGIIVARQTKERKFRITPLLRWRVHERQELLDSAENFLAEVTPGEGVFPKLHKDLLPLYDFAKKQKKILGQILARQETMYKLIVPSTPRYFISALKRAVERTSFKVLYFNSEKEMNLAYLLLNSSYMYWWWRVNDGGMTISEKTLLTLPIFDDLSLNQSLISKIEESEKTNRVIKRNAGKDNENVKHDDSLVQEINENVIPRFAYNLGFIHNNSVIKRA